MMKRGLLSAALALAVSLILLAASVYLLGTNDALMYRLMERHAPPQATGLPAAEYPGVVQMITGYLRGETAQFQYTYALGSAECRAFNEKEQRHMADVQGLFHLARRVLVFGGMALLPLLGLSLWRGGRSLLRGIRNGLTVVLALVGIVAIWAAADFDSLFILFHQMAFTNDLWWLDPRTDLLIRLMPTDFFVSYAALIGGVWATAMGLAALMTHLLVKERNK